jgi:hypothetical protein
MDVEIGQHFLESLVPEALKHYMNMKSDDVSNFYSIKKSRLSGMTILKKVKWSIVKMITKMNHESYC